MRVLMIDGASRETTAPDGSSARWRWMLGSELEALVPDQDTSPKLRTPVSQRIVGRFRNNSEVRGDDGFIAVGAHARGGLSQIWGGFACEFDSSDLAGWPISPVDLAPSYRSVTERIGVSGSSTDDMAGFYGRSSVVLPPLPVGPLAGEILRRYRPGSQGSNFGLGLARHAILTVDKDNRLACDLRNHCIWGCERGAIYDARSDVQLLAKHENFRILDDALACALTRTSAGWTVTLQNRQGLHAPRIVLAAGTLGTLPLVIPLVPSPPQQLRLLTNPVFAMPLLMPRYLGRPAPDCGYSLAQFGYRYRYAEEPAEYVTGVGFEVTGLPLSSIAARLPFSRRAAMEFVRPLSSAMLICTGFLPGTCSNNTVRWRQDGERASIVVSGGFASHLTSKFQDATAALRKIWRQLGAWVLPGTALAAPGADVHYAGPFAMGSQMPHGTTAFGELHCAPGVFIADGASFPTLPSKFLTLTVMANADRIGRRLASMPA
jgi:choline dehydrogenase-like flavoprotein